MTRFTGEIMTRDLVKRMMYAGMTAVFVVTALAAPAGTAPEAAPEATGGIMAMLSSFMKFMRSETVSTAMWWLNLAVLLFLLYKFVFPLILKMLDETLTDIETTLSSEEAEKRKIEEQKATLRRSIEGIQSERERLIDAAKTEAEYLKKEILGEARDMEMRIFDNVEKSATGYYLRRLNDIKNNLFGEVSNSFVQGHSNDKGNAARKEFDSKAIRKVGS